MGGADTSAASSVPAAVAAGPNTNWSGYVIKDFWGGSAEATCTGFVLGSCEIPDGATSATAHDIETTSSFGSNGTIVTDPKLYPTGSYTEDGAFTSTVYTEERDPCAIGDPRTFSFTAYHTPGPQLDSGGPLTIGFSPSTEVDLSSSIPISTFAGDTEHWTQTDCQGHSSEGDAAGSETNPPLGEVYTCDRLVRQQGDTAAGSQSFCKLSDGGLTMCGYATTWDSGGGDHVSSAFCLSLAANCSVCTPTDTDADGVPDPVDNCPAVANPYQEDGDGDGVGAACDPNDSDPNVPYPDQDKDRVPNSQDNCPSVPNPTQTDSDQDGVGDACDPDGGIPSAACGHVMHVTFAISHSVSFPAGLNRCWTFDHPAKGNPKSGGGIQPPKATNPDWREHWHFCGIQNEAAQRPLAPGYWVYEDFTLPAGSVPQAAVAACASNAATEAGSQEGAASTDGYVEWAYRCHSHVSAAACAKQRKNWSSWFPKSAMQSMESSAGVDRLFFQLYDPTSPEGCPAGQRPCTAKHPLATPSLWKSWLAFHDSAGRHVGGAGIVDVTSAPLSAVKTWVLTVCKASYADGFMGIYSGANLSGAREAAVVTALNRCTQQ